MEGPLWARGAIDIPYLSPSLYMFYNFEVNHVTVSFHGIKLITNIQLINLQAIRMT